MQPKYFKLISMPTKIPNREFSAYLHDTFLNPLKKLGFHAISCSTTCDDPGIHLLYLKHDGNTEYRIDLLKTICEQDDDGQPTSCYSHYLGDLMIFIPYFS